MSKKTSMTKTESEENDMVCMSSTKLTFLLLSVMAAGTLLGALGFTINRGMEKNGTS